MGKSFFLGTDAELYTGSDNFSTKITATPTAYGLVAGQATAYAALNTAWRSAYVTANTPATRTKAAVASKNAARSAVRIMASDLAKIIDGTSTVTNAQKIDLGLNVRATPSPKPPPGKPTDLVVTLDETGMLNLAWKCANPAGVGGTTYSVFRKTGDDVEFQYLGGSGTRSFIDETLAAGSINVQYKMQAIRSTASGPWATFNVNFGVSSSGAMTIASVTEAPTKIAA